MKVKKEMFNLMEKVLMDEYQRILHNPQKYSTLLQCVAPKKAKGVKYISFLGSTGYADAAKGYVRSLIELGVYVYFETVRCHGGKSIELLSDDDLILAVCLNNSHIQYDTVIIHTVPHYWPDIIRRERSINPLVKIYGLTVWETDRVFPKWLKIISQSQLTGLIVPSNWNKQTFEQSARQEGYFLDDPLTQSSKKGDMTGNRFPPIFTCHHLIADRSFPSCINFSRDNLYGSHIKTAFLCIGTWTPRKGIAETIEAYLKAFDGQKHVVLYLKTNSGSYSKQDEKILKDKLQKIIVNYRDPPKIILDTQLRSEDYIEALVQHCDVYFSLCNSEGVGLGACSAALKGKVIIMTGYGGQIEYIKKASWVEYKLAVVQVPSHFAEWIRPPQKWAYPNISKAVEYLQDVHLNLKSYKHEAMVNRSFLLNQFSALVIGNQLQSILYGCHRPLSKSSVKLSKGSEKDLLAANPHSQSSSSSQSSSDSSTDSENVTANLSSEDKKAARKLAKERHQLRRQRHLERRRYRLLRDPC